MIIFSYSNINYNKMFGGKKITASCNNKIIQTKPNKQITTKITQQIIGKPRQSIKNNNQYPQQQGIQKGEKTDRLQKIYKNTKMYSLNKQKQILKTNKKEMVPNNQKNMNKNNKEINKKQQTDPNLMYTQSHKENKNNKSHNRNIIQQTMQVNKQIKESQNKQKRKPQLYNDNTQIQNYQAEDQKQMSGEHDFVDYSDNQQGQQQQQLRVIPQPYEQIKILELPIQTCHNNIAYNTKQIKQLNQFNMDVFSLQVDQIMAKQYFIV